VESADLVKDFRDAMSRFPGAVTAITTLDGDAPVGLIATAVCSLSAEPPSLIACVNRSSSTHDIILRSGFFAVNVLSGELSNVLEQFSTRRGAERFDGLTWTAGVTGAPLLAGAHLAFDCEVANVHDGFSHSIIVGTVRAIEQHASLEAHALLWQGRSLHRAIEIEKAE